jgi:hypothetical protein
MRCFQGRKRLAAIKSASVYATQLTVYATGPTERANTGVPDADRH